MTVKDNASYEGVILPLDDPKKKGRYLVFIPRFQMVDKSKIKPAKGFNGVWCYNRLGNFSRYTDVQLRNYKEYNSYGNYTPLYPGTRVNVKFKEDDLNTGFITDIISYDVPPNNDRDNFFLLSKTSKSSWLWIDEANSTFAISFHRGRSNVWGDDEKIHLSKSTGTVVEINDDWITSFHKDGPYIHIDSTQISLRIGETYIKLTENGIDIHTPGTINSLSGGDTNIDGANTWINSGHAAPVDPGAKHDIAKPSLDDIEVKNVTDENLHVKVFE